MNVLATAIPGLLIIEPHMFPDERGVFFESWSESRYTGAGMPAHFVQDNVSRSVRGVLRGLHYQQPNMQGKLITVLQGEAYDVVVDIRQGSPTFRQWVGVVLSATNQQQVYVPPGCAHGFQALSPEALIQYKCTACYDSASEHSILWSDEDLAISWPLAPVLSRKDQHGVRLRDLRDDALPRYDAS